MRIKKNGRLRRVVHSRHCWACVLVVISFLAAGQVAAAPKTTFVKADNISRHTSPLGRLRADVLTKTYFPNQNLPAVFNKTNIPLSTKNVARAARLGLGGPVSAAIAVAMVANEWIAYKNEQGDWEIGEPPVEPLDCDTINYENTCAYANSHPDVECYKMYNGEPVSILGTKSSPDVITDADIPHNGHVSKTCSTSAATIKYATWAANVADWDDSPEPVSDPEIEDAVADKMADKDIEDMINDYLTKYADDWSSDASDNLRQVIDLIRNAHQKKLDGQPLTSEEDDIVNNDETTTEIATKDSQEIKDLLKTINATMQGLDTSTTVNVDVPTNCTLLPVLCDFIDWFKTEDPLPENPAIPVDDVQAEDFNSGLGGGSCPAPVSFSLQGRSMVYSYDTACARAVDTFKPFLLLIASLASAYILLGVRSGNA
jgi:hypothetical protein